MRTSRTSARGDEAGYSLVEVVVCVALTVAVAVVALGALPQLARNAEAGIVQDAATEVARNAIERIRAAAAYVPAGLVTDPAARAVVAADHRWVLGATASAASVARIVRPWCGAGTASVDVALAIASTYDAASDRLTVTVTYPRDPCAGSGPTDAVTLGATLAPAAYAPQTQLPVAIGDPATQ